MDEKILIKRSPDLAKRYTGISRKSLRINGILFIFEQRNYRHSSNHTHRSLLCPKDTEINKIVCHMLDNELRLYMRCQPTCNFNISYQSFSLIRKLLPE